MRALRRCGLLALACCAGFLAGPTGEARPRPDELHVHVVVESAADFGPAHVIAPGELLHNHDRFWLLVEVSQDASVYLLHDKAGCRRGAPSEAPVLLTPAPNGMRLRRRGFHRILDQDLSIIPPAGIEDLYVVAAAEPISEKAAQQVVVAARPGGCTRPKERARRPACGPGVSAFDCLDPSLPGEYSRYRDIALRQPLSQRSLGSIVVVRVPVAHD